MVKVISDLQLHSKYARAVSKEMVIPKIWEWAKRKGIGIVATGDWTHPLWMREIKSDLEEMGNGLLRLKKQETINNKQGEEPYFLLEAEVSSIYSQGGKLRRIHNLIWSPSIATSEKINKALLDRGANLISDGRPIIGLTSIQVAEIVFSIDPTCLLIPAHCWTPWFSMYGSESGFDSVDECFGDYSKYIFAIETGLSSDPSMNWRIKELDNRSILSFSDAHSGPKLGREATVFDLTDLSFRNIRQAIVRPAIEKQLLNNKNNKKSDDKIAYTIEFHPEEGKYHYTGHRNCGVKHSPEETRQKGTICPVCGRKLTVGVMHRVDQLAGRTEEELKLQSQELYGTKATGVFSRAFTDRPPFTMLVPLHEILAEAIGGLPTGQKVVNEYKKLTDYFETEFKVLLEVNTKDIVKISGERVAEAIEKVRQHDIVVDPGYDGVFGKVKIWGNDEEKKNEKAKEQMSLF